MSAWSLYDPATGLLLGRYFSGPAEAVAANTPPGMAAVRGRFDPLSQRVDITAQPPAAPTPPEPPSIIPAEQHDTWRAAWIAQHAADWVPPVIDYQPPAPAADTWRTWSWDTATKRWLVVPTLAYYQRDKLIKLKAAALNASEQDITVQSITFAADAATRAELAQELALAQAEGAGYSCDWERADGTSITLTGAQVKGLLRAISTRLASIRAQFRARKASVAAATTQAQVEAITWA